MDCLFFSQSGHTEHNQEIRLVWRLIRSVKVCSSLFFLALFFVSREKAIGMVSFSTAKHSVHPTLWPVQTQSEFSISNSEGAKGQPIPLNIQLQANSTAAFRFLMVRNLPLEFKLSAGFGAKNYWAVSLNDVAGLQILPPRGFSGEFPLEVLLIRSNGAEPERIALNVAIAQNGTSLITVAGAAARSHALVPSTSPNSAIDGPQDAYAPPSPSDVTYSVEGPSINTISPQPAQMSDADQAQMARGNQLLQQGDIASARLVYKRLAQKNFAEAAYAMGNTYDPEFLTALSVTGMQPDLTEAKKWYQSARSLGSANAAQRLSSFAQRGY